MTRYEVCPPGNPRRLGVYASYDGSNLLLTDGNEGLLEGNPGYRVRLTAAV